MDNSIRISGIVLLLSLIQVAINRRIAQTDVLGQIDKAEQVINTDTIVGPPAPQGPEGDAGPPGPDGPAGADGPAGTGYNDYGTDTVIDGAIDPLTRLSLFQGACSLANPALPVLKTVRNAAPDAISIF
jgi:hypothetical protein